MPTVKKIDGPYRFFFYSFDCNELMHIHVQREKRICKYWLEPIVLSKNYGFTSNELRKIKRIIEENIIIIREAWYEHCGESK